MKRLLLISFLFVSVFSAKAQTGNHKNCATMERIPVQFRAERIAAMETKVAKWITDYRQSPAYKTEQNFVIPVVFHVLYKKAEENISDEQIQSQIDVLNADFAGLNEDSTRVPIEFKPLFAKSTIQFCLAKTDPNGQPTNGITRKQTEITEFPAFSDLVAKPDSGGATPWDSNKYLNIYSCNIGGGLYGFASFPDSAGRPSDGVVCKYNAIGLNGSAVPPSNKGRTATHEVGHYLSLLHVWGDAVCGNDNIDDTPTQEQANFGCPLFPHVTCNNGPNGDMFVNYMDYSDDLCLTMFTPKQVERMTAALTGPRASLLSSEGCQLVGLSEKMDARWTANIYPNPTADGKFTLALDKITEKYSVTVTDLVGQTILKRENVKEPRLTLEIDRAAGVYFVKIQTETFSQTKRIFVR